VHAAGVDAATKSPRIVRRRAQARGWRRRSWNQARYLLILSRCAAGYGPSSGDQRVFVSSDHLVELHRRSDPDHGEAANRPFLAMIGAEMLIVRLLNPLIRNPTPRSSVRLRMNESGPS
jgi:hypothetical protein